LAGSDAEVSVDRDGKEERDPVAEIEIDAELETVEVVEGFSEMVGLKERLWEIEAFKETGERTDESKNNESYLWKNPKQRSVRSKT